MSVVYSLRIKPNWLPSLSPAWGDYTGNLMTDALPSIQVSAERADVPLTTVVSDFSVTLNNAGNEFDDLFSLAKIVGPLPPVSGTGLRAPIVHMGKVLFCRLSGEQAKWEVVFFGYIDPASVRFDRSTKEVTITAYAPGKLLELGNAARVNKISAYAPAPPFVIFTGATYLLHPVIPPGAISTENSWWILNGLTNLPLVGGDRFRIVRAPAGWAENEQLTTISDTEFNIRQVIPDFANNQTYIQTEEEPDLSLGFSQAAMELLTPWYRGLTWETLVQLLIAEVNAALISVGYTDDAISAVTTGLTLLPATSKPIAQLINMADVAPPVNGIAYHFWSTTRYLFLTTQPNATQTMAEGKSDILGPINLGPVTVGVYSVTPVGGYLPGPADGKPVRLLSPNLDIGSNGPLYNGGPGGNDVSLCGQDIHSYNNAGGFANKQTFDSTHWSRSPAGMFSGTEPKTYYQIYARGRYFSAGTPATAGFRRGIQISKVTTPDSGGTWTLDSSSNNMTTVPLDSDDNPQVEPFFGQNGSSTQVDFKCFKLGSGSYLYCWTDPYKGEAYFKASATGEEAASFFFPPPTSFIIPGAGDILRPVGASGFVTEGIGAGIFFFCERADGNGVFPYIWNGSTFAAGSFNVQPSLAGADFINAAIDVSRNKIYIALGSSVLVGQYVAVGATFNWASTTYVPVDQVNYDQIAERQANSILRPGALLWIAGPVIQNNPGEPDYTTALDAMLLGSQFAVYILANTPANLVDYADFEGLSAAGALAQLILVRGYQMITGADQPFVTDPALYTPGAVVTFRARLNAAPTIVDLTAPVNLCEQCEDGIWLLNYTAVGVQNSRSVPQLGPFFNQRILTNLAGAAFTTNPSRNAPSSALILDNRYLGTSSFAQLLANIYAQDFLVPQPDATLLLVDPYTAGYGLQLKPLDVVKYLKRSPDSTDPNPLFGQGRVFSVDYGLDVNQLTVRVG